MHTVESMVIVGPRQHLYKRVRASVGSRLTMALRVLLLLASLFGGSNAEIRAIAVYESNFENLPREDRVMMTLAIRDIWVQRSWLSLIAVRNQPRLRKKVMTSVELVLLSNKRGSPPVLTSSPPSSAYKSNVWSLVIEPRCSTSFRLNQLPSTPLEKLSNLVFEIQTSQESILRDNFENCNRTSWSKQTIFAPPFLIREQTHGMVKWSGSNVDLFRAIADSVGFNFLLREPADHTLGILSNVSANGLLEMAFKNEIDLTLYICVYQSQTYFDMIWPSYYGHWAIVVPPPAVTYDLLSNIKPFGLDVWLCVIASILSVSFTMWAVSRRFAARSDLALDMLYNIALITGQGGFSPKYLTGKFLAATWNLGAFVIIFSYTSILISFVTARIPEARLSSFEDFVTKGTLKPAAHDQHIFLTYFLNADSGLAKQIGDIFRRNPTSTVFCDDEGINLVLGGRHAFITGVPMAEAAIVDDFKSTGKCRMTMVLGNGINHSLVGWFTSKLVPSLTRALHKGILNANEAGLLSYYEKLYVPRINCLGMRNVVQAPSNSPLLLVQLQTSFLVLGLGLVAAFIALIHEHIKYKGCLC